GPVAPRSVRLPRAPGSSALSSSARPRLPALPDLVDLAVAVARQSVQVDPQCFVELLDLLVGAGFGERVPVENLALGHLGLVGPSHLGDARLLLVGQRTLCGAGVSILLTQALHRKLERRLGGLVGHDGGQCSIQSNARLASVRVSGASPGRSSVTFDDRVRRRSHESTNVALWKRVRGGSRAVPSATSPERRITPSWRASSGSPAGRRYLGSTGWRSPQTRAGRRRPALVCPGASGPGGAPVRRDPRKRRDSAQDSARGRA